MVPTGRVTLCLLDAAHAQVCKPNQRIGNDTSASHLKPEFCNACPQRGLDGHELLSNYAKHFYANAIELIKASPRTTLSQTCRQSSVPVLHKSTLCK